MSISALQLRMARAALKWGVRRLAAKAGLSPDTIMRAEQGSDVTVKTWGAIQRALEESGIEFLSEVTSVSLHTDVTKPAICADPDMPLGVRRIYPRRLAQGTGPYEISVVRWPLPSAPLADDITNRPANRLIPPQRVQTEAEALAYCRKVALGGYTGLEVTGPNIHWGREEVLRRLNSAIP
jgi:hypothetical protein